MPGFLKLSLVVQLLKIWQALQKLQGVLGQLSKRSRYYKFKNEHCSFGQKLFYNFPIACPETMNFALLQHWRRHNSIKPATVSADFRLFA